MTRGRRPAAAAGPAATSAPVPDTAAAPVPAESGTDPETSAAAEPEDRAAGDPPAVPEDPAPSGGPGRPRGTAVRGERARAQAVHVWRGLMARPVRTTVVATVVGLLGLGAAVAMAAQADELRGPAANTALVDQESTARLLGDVNAAVERTYGYAFDSLDADERAAQDAVVGAFADRFREEFTTVRELAPAQQATVTATVRESAVQSLRGSRAEVLVFVDQTIRNLELPEGAASGARLVVTAELVDGRWRIADVLSR